ncbi:hypothetical protein C8P64_1992 [Christiangramia gaetbulicola]|uniref:Uncharacterized protein n=1 Tax=Christiangramia gaetbulicola TaxID=703340 RepID=A0A2T6AI22_9FLAO|nr:hypothetical protein C8P64_1992 [Christiangramia gaetbulicola]
MIQKILNIRPIFLYMLSGLITFIAREFFQIGSVSYYIMIAFAILLFILAIIRLLK